LREYELDDVPRELQHDEQSLQDHRQLADPDRGQNCEFMFSAVQF
jgi:hypothetical protein